MTPPITPEGKKIYRVKRYRRRGSGLVVPDKKIEVPRQKIVKAEPKYLEDLGNKKVPYVLTRWPRTNQELWLFVKATWGVEIPYKKVCPGHVAPFQAFADAFFARHPVAIWKASRGFGGKTFLLSLLGSTEMVALKCLVTILGGSSDQSLRVHESMKQFFDYEGAPGYLVEKMTSFNTFLTNGASARTLTASQKSVRGPHPQRLRLDEIDEMELAILRSAQGQPMRTKRLPGVDTQTVMSSTHQYPDGTMTKMIQEAGDRNWPVYHWCVVRDTMVSTVRGPIPVQDVMRGDIVVGWDEKDEKLAYARVEKSGYTRTTKVVAVRTETGEELSCTPDHQILSAEGWKEAGSIADGDDIVRQVPAMPRDSRGARGGFQENEDGVLLGLLAEKQDGRQPEDLRLWQSEECSFHDVPDMLSSGDGSAEHGQQSIVGEEEGRTQESSYRVQVGRTGGGPSGLLRHGVQKTGGDIHLHGGLPSSRKGGVGGSGLAAHQGRTRDSLCEEEEKTGDDGVQGRGALVGREPPLVHSHTRVASIKPAGIADVYDLTVEKLHSFVANGIVVHNCYLETSAPGGWLAKDEIKRKKSEVSKSMWSAEYELQEPSFEGRAFDQDSVSRMFDPSLGEFPGHPTKYLEFAEPRNDRDYITGVDWAKMLHFTVVWTFDTTELPWRTVAWQRLNRMPWPRIISLVNLRMRRFPGKLIHDVTGLGSVVKDLLKAEGFMGNRDIHDQILAGSIRNEILTDYVVAVESGHLLSPRVQWCYDQHRFCTDEDLYGRGHLPDSVCAGALAWHERRKGITDDQVAGPDMEEELLHAGGVSPWRFFEREGDW